ncbi:hypothetical protein [Candidatus Sulfurimonas baltica]|uniref:Uncharacterized protein n=1 Tax=Candidatus Sulfurimonas baltica TaxID=2740404 RepID=A0A7S7RP57_9BACT|nr:hypothetical protein [Candidatus Sulfurimonas baltica]QOY53249.1 hypothetical protein HUE88_06095 [Candidatus Sulfurimonas baltica]
MRQFILLIIFSNLLFGNSFNTKIIKNTEDIDFIIQNKKISQNHPLILIFDNGTHAKKVISIIENTLLNNKINFLKNNIFMINRNFQSSNELSDIDIISYLSKKLHKQQIFINMSYGYSFNLPSRYVSYTNNPFFNNKLKNELDRFQRIASVFNNKIEKLNNVTIYKSFGNYILFDDKKINMKKSTKQSLSIIYQYLCGNNYDKKIKLSNYIRNYLYTKEKIDFLNIKSYIEKNISMKSDLNNNVIKNLIRYSEVELFSQYINNSLIGNNNVKLVESINYDSIYSSYKKSDKTYPNHLKNDLDNIYIEYLKSDSLNMVRYNFSYIDKVNNFILKYQNKYPELFISVYENYSTLDLNKKNILAPQGQVFNIKYETVNEILVDNQKRFIGTSASSPQALSYGVIKYLNQNKIKLNLD